MHGYNTDTVNELKFWTKEIGYFYVHCYKILYVIKIEETNYDWLKILAP